MANLPKDATPESTMDIVRGRFKVDIPGKPVASWFMGGCLNVMLWARKISLKAEKPHLSDGEVLWQSIQDVTAEYTKAYLAAREKEFKDVDETKP